MLSIRSVTKRFGQLTALDDISLDLPKGEFFGLLGPNGAGKTTLMSLIAGLGTPEKGTLEINGLRISAADPSSRRIIGLVPQVPALYGELSAERNLRLFGSIYGLGGAALKKAVDGALEIAQLRERRHDAVKTFSGGMQRRLNLVVALLHKPALLLCDEPTVGVDPQSRNAIFDTLLQLNREGMTIIYSTHYMEEAERLCSQIGIIDHGRILAQGRVDELLGLLPFEELISFPATPQTAPLSEKLKNCGSLSSSETTHVFKPAPDFRLSAFFGLSESLGLPARLFESKRPTLESLFLHLTGRKLRE